MLLMRNNINGKRWIASRLTPIWLKYLYACMKEIYYTSDFCVCVCLNKLLNSAFRVYWVLEWALFYWHDWTFTIDMTPGEKEKIIIQNTSNFN